MRFQDRASIKLSWNKDPITLSHPEVKKDLNNMYDYVFNYLKKSLIKAVIMIQTIFRSFIA